MDNVSVTEHSNHSVLSQNQSPRIYAAAECQDVYSKQLKETYKERVSRKAYPLTSLPLSPATHMVVAHKVQNVRGKKDRKERKGRMCIPKKGRKVKDGSFKHTQAGTACQNTLPSPNWVIFDTPYRMVPAY